VAAAKDSTAEPLIMSEALAARLTAALGISDPEKAENLRAEVAKVREWSLAVAPDAPPRLLPAEAARQLERLARSLERGDWPNGGALTHHSARWLLRKASVELEGGRYVAEYLICDDDYGRALPIVRAALRKAHKAKSEKPSRPRQNAKTTAVSMLGKAYEEATGQLPTRGGKNGPLPFELFLGLALSDIYGDSGPALAKRWQRARMRVLQNAHCNVRPK
jgi:hypothetical protein